MKRNAYFLQTIPSYDGVALNVEQEQRPQRLQTVISAMREETEKTYLAVLRLFDRIVLAWDRLTGGRGRGRGGDDRVVATHF